MQAPSAQSHLSPPELGAVAFTGLYMTISLVAAIIVGNQEFVFYFAVMCVLIVAAGLVHWRMRLHVAALWGLALWGLAHMAGGLMPVPASWPIHGEAHVLYNAWIVPGMLKYDQVVHAYGFGLMTWICWQLLARAFTKRGVAVRPSLGLLTLCLAGGMGFGAMNEVVEFVATLLLPNTNVGGYVNTGWDLVANLTGSTIAAVALFVHDKCTARPLANTATQ